MLIFTSQNDIVSYRKEEVSLSVPDIESTLIVYRQRKWLIT
jgi:hypothetical protein